MAKVLKCADLNPGCDTVIVGKDADEVFAKAEAHARKDHNMTIIPPSVMSQIEAAIKEKTSAAPVVMWDRFAGRRSCRPA